jgi:hypothetical protein
MITHFFNLKINKNKSTYLINKRINNNNNVNKNIVDLENNESFQDDTSQDDIKITLVNDNLNIIHLHNIYGLGDGVFNIIFFHLIKEYMINNKIQIYYYTKTEYIYQLNQINDNSNVRIFPLDKKPINSIDLWINNEYFNYTYTNFYDNNKKKVNNRVDYNGYYLDFFNIVLYKLKFNTSINSILYSGNDLLTRFTENIPPEYKKFDILILNSQPFSGQYNYKKHIWDKYIKILNSNFKILTTTKVHGVLCTFDKRLSIKDIASLSTQAKVIIFVNSGVFPGLLNTKTIERVKQFYVFDDRCYYSYPNFKNKECITEISFNELNYYVNLK